MVPAPAQCPNCTPCSDPIALGNDRITFQQSALIILCEILSALTGGSVTPTDATWLYSNYAYTSITNAFTTALTNTHDLKFLKLENLTDTDLIISFDATNNHLYVAAGDRQDFDLNASARTVSTSVSVKYVSAPTSGELIVTGYY